MLTQRHTSSPLNSFISSCPVLLPLSSPPSIAHPRCHSDPARHRHHPHALQDVLVSLFFQGMNIPSLPTTYRGAHRSSQRVSLYAWTRPVTPNPPQDESIQDRDLPPDVTVATLSPSSSFSGFQSPSCSSSLPPCRTPRNPSSHLAGRPTLDDQKSFISRHRLV